MPYRTRFNSINSLYSALPVPFVPMWVTRSALVTHSTSQYHRTFIPLFVSLCKNICDPVFDGVRLAGFKTRSNVYWPKPLAPFLSSNVFPFFSSFYGLLLWGLGLWTDKVSIVLSQPCVVDFYK